jgi:hypothetical protein
MKWIRIFIEEGTFIEKQVTEKYLIKIYCCKYKHNQRKLCIMDSSKFMLIVISLIISIYVGGKVAMKKQILWNYLIFIKENCMIS